MAAGAGSAVAPPGGLARVTELDRSQSSTLKSMRLEALRDAPSAFVATWEAERDRPPDYWEEQFVRATWVIAQHGARTVGIAALVEPEPKSLVRFVESVWVEPEYRWCGVLRQMLDHLEERAKEDGANELRLWVLDTNESAEEAYLKLGFSLQVDQEQDTAKQRADGTFVKERLMTKPIL
jgi:GNAT superfamily N-acetyltransferase